MAISTQPAFRSRISQWLNERLGLQGIAYAVPEHANSVPYILGGITLAGFVILFITGIYLAQFYHPHPVDAHDSVVYIITGAPLGDLMRSTHFWTAQIVTVTVLLHVLRVLFTGAYKRPRAINWYVGLGLLAVTLGLVFTGSVLKADCRFARRMIHGSLPSTIPLRFAQGTIVGHKPSAPIGYLAHIGTRYSALGMTICAYYTEQRWTQ